jgi:hypothetical protein
VIALNTETLIGLRAFPESQRLWADTPAVQLGGRTVSWYGSDLRPEAPAFCVVNRTADDSDVPPLVGELLAITRGRATIYVYCIASATIPTDIAVTRRAFIGLGRLTEDSVDCTVGIL